MNNAAFLASSFRIAMAGGLFVVISERETRRRAIRFTVAVALIRPIEMPAR